MAVEWKPEARYKVLKLDRPRARNCGGYSSRLFNNMRARVALVDEGISQLL